MSNKYNIGDVATVQLTGNIEEIRSGYNDGELRYKLDCGHCVHATVKESQLQMVGEPITKEEREELDKEEAKEEAYWRGFYEKENVDEEPYKEEG